MNFIVPYIGNFIIPIDEVIFFGGVAQPPTSGHKWTSQEWGPGFPTLQPGTDIRSLWVGSAGVRHGSFIENADQFDAEFFSGELRMLIHLSVIEGDHTNGYHMGTIWAHPPLSDFTIPTNTNPAMTWGLEDYFRLKTGCQGSM